MKQTDLKKQVPLRLSAGLYDRLAKWAEEDFRSLNGQIEYLLTACVRRREGGGTSLWEENDRTDAGGACAVSDGEE